MNTKFAKSALIIKGREYSFDDVSLIESLQKADELHLRELAAFLMQWFDSQPHIVQQTSGSTGAPKRISISKQHMCNSAWLTIKHFDLTPGMTAMLCMSPRFIGGRMMVVRALLAGLKLLVIKPEDNPLRELNHTVDFAAMVPFQFSRACNESPEKFRLVKKLILGGAPLSSLQDKLAQSLSSQIWHTFGMSETLSHIALRKVNGFDRDIAFQALQGIDVHLDESNCLVINAPQLGCHMLRTNDIAEIKTDGKFILLGRADNVIISAGYKLYPESIEQQLGSLLDLPFAVVGLSDAEAGEVAVLVLEGNLSPRQIYEFWKTAENILPTSQLPRRIILTNKLPLTDSGKIDRQTLKKQLHNL